MDMMQSIIKREFEKASGRFVRTVTFTQGEEIIVTTADVTYTMEIGSDDDEFVFTGERPDDPVVRFAYPDDWWEADDENNS